MIRFSDARGTECGVNPAQRAAIRIHVLNRRAEGRELFCLTHDDDVSVQRSHYLHSMVDQQPVAQPQKRLLFPHAGASAACQDESGHVPHVSFVSQVFARGRSDFTVLPSLHQDPKKSEQDTARFSRPSVSLKVQL